MSEKIIQTLRASPLATFLDEAELRMLADCGRVHEYAADQDIVLAEDRNKRLFLLEKGKVDLHLNVLEKTGQCDGNAHIELNTPGELFGWAAWIRADRVEISARAEETVLATVFDLERLGDGKHSLKIGYHMLELVYAHLQEHRICPPNVQALLKFKKLLQSVGET